MALDGALDSTVGPVVGPPPVGSSGSPGADPAGVPPLPHPAEGQHLGPIPPDVDPGPGIRVPGPGRRQSIEHGPLASALAAFLDADRRRTVVTAGPHTSGGFVAATTILTMAKEGLVAERGRGRFVLTDEGRELAASLGLGS